MSLVIALETPPLAADAGGTVRIGGTRVTLDTVIKAFQAGENAEQIADQYPAITLADVYAVITYYLRHRITVEKYLEDRQREAEEIRRKVEAHSPPGGRREELESRRARGKPS